MRIKLLESVGNTTFTLQYGDIVDAKDYPEAQRWVNAGIATLVEDDIETADLPKVQPETATMKRTYKKK